MDLDPDHVTRLIEPWLKLGVVGSAVIGLAALNIWQLRRSDRKAEEYQKTLEALHEARLADQKEFAVRYAEIVVNDAKMLNRMADGMEAFERVVDRVRPA